jgi:hypothetical protein
MTRQTVVIEYEFKGYTQPNDLEAMRIECKVTHSDAPLSGTGGDLAQVRAALDDAGYERQPETAPTERYQARRWCPTWREVWAREVEVCAPLHDLSPEAAKAQFEAAGRMRGWWPWLKRTSTKAILKRPRNGGYKHRKAFAQWVAENLTDFRFNSKRNWWEASLDYLPKAYEILRPDGVNVSDGVQDYLEVTR